MEATAAFEWDDNKAASNRRKHGVSFEEAEAVFDDPKVLIFDDLAHSDTEDRRIAIGISNKGRLVVLSHTMRGDNVRLITARKATQAEIRNYGQS